MISGKDLTHMLIRAYSLGIDPTLITAFVNIYDSDEAKNFKEIDYPVKIVGEYFPNIDKKTRDRFLDSTTHIELNKMRTRTAFTPRTIASLRIRDAYEFYISTFGEDDPNVRLIRKIWGFE
jgi:hypothetical protein